MKHKLWTGIGVVTLIVVGVLMLTILPTITAHTPTVQEPRPTSALQQRLQLEQYENTLTPAELWGFNVGKQLGQQPNYRPTISHDPTTGGVHLAVSYTFGLYVYVHFTHADARTIVNALNSAGTGYATALAVGIVAAVSSGVGTAIGIFIAANSLLYFFLATLAVDDEHYGVGAWWCGYLGNFIPFQGCPKVDGQVGAAYLVPAPFTSPSGYRWEVNVRWTGFTVDMPWWEWAIVGGYNMDYPACPR
jgi:hypothetical protein